ncbi:Rha family transcriptional regulator [Yersinia sp. 2553 StPb PI]|uniref:Rha family transcriptional regulator n=1 Tax=Yersinia sp. 2553 StPb PI TaxID=3117411 RepID=UPI003FA48EF6
MAKKIELVINGAPMMGTKEIAKLAGKRHDNAIRDVWEMLDSLYGISKDSSDLRNNKNQQVTLVSGVIACIDSRGFVSEFLLDRRHTEILITGYDVKRRAAVIDRWFTLETGNTQAVAAIPDLSRLDILQMALDSEQGRIAEKQRADTAIRAKGQISRKREASAMGKLSAATRRCRELEERLGESTKDATITKVENATGLKKTFKYAALRKWCRDNGTEARSVADERYGSVKSWPAGAWLTVYGIDLTLLFGEKK